MCSSVPKRNITNRVERIFSYQGLFINYILTLNKINKYYALCFEDRAGLFFYFSTHCTFIIHTIHLLHPNKLHPGHEHLTVTVLYKKHSLSHHIKSKCQHRISIEFLCLFLFEFNFFTVMAYLGVSKILHFI